VLGGWSPRRDDVALWQFDKQEAANELKKYWETQKKNKLIRQLSNKIMANCRACGGKLRIVLMNKNV
jgi:hypothetical protein